MLPFDGLQIAFVVVSGLLAVFAIAWLLRVEDKLGALREACARVSIKAAGLGLVKHAKGFSLFACDEPIKLQAFFVHEVEAFVENPDKYFATEVASALTSMAKTPDGLTALQAAVASVATATASAAAAPRAL